VEGVVLDINEEGSPVAVTCHGTGSFDCTVKKLENASADVGLVGADTEKSVLEDDQKAATV
jgi:hypothetical protein